MPELRLFYQNCNCCSGSGSSGSGSCQCNFFRSDLDFGECSSYPVSQECQTEFYLTVNLSFSHCSGLPIGSCGSGSLASGVVDGSETGSVADCVTECPNCCDLFDFNFEIPLICLGQTLVSKNLVVDSPEYNECFSGSAPLAGYGSIGSCLKHKKCPYFVLSSDGTGHLAIPIDNWPLHFYIPGYDGGFSIDSCNPLQITINASAFSGDLINDISAPCLANCFGRNGLKYPTWVDQGLTLADVTFDASCIKATMTITENSLGGGGGGGGAS